MTHNVGARVSRTRKVLAAGAVGMLCATGAAGVVIALRRFGWMPRER